MSFLLPLGLAALVAVPIVVLLHMRHTTPTVRPVPTLRFWLAAEPERTERTRFRRPPLSLLLILHLLIAAALALALARPVTARALDALGLGMLGGLRTEPQHLILLLDGSTSMSATDTADGRTRFEVARARALDRLAGLREGDVATVVLLGTHVATLGATDTASRGALRERLGVLPLPGGRADLDAALRLTRDLLLPELEDRVVVLTDGAVAADPSTVTALGAPIELRVFGAAAESRAADNAAIVDLSSSPLPGNPTQLQLFARVMNFSGQARSAPVILSADGIEIARQEVSLPGNGGSDELSWPLPPGIGEASVRIEAADALAADDVAALILGQDEAAALSLRVLLVSDAPAALQRALQALPGAEVRTELSGAFAEALAGERYDLIVFEKAAPAAEAVAGFGTPLLFVNPPPNGPFPAQGAMVAPTVSRLRAQDPLLAGVDLAGATFGETPVYTLGAGQEEIVGAAEGPLVFRAEVGGQPAITFAFDLGGSNLPRRVVFPILVTNAVRELAPSPLPSAVPLGDPLRYRPGAGTSVVRVTSPDGTAVDLALSAGAVDDDAAPTSAAGGETESATLAQPDAQPDARRTPEISYADTGRAGVYEVQELDAAGTELGSGRFVVNAGHPRESDLRPTIDLADTLAQGRATGPAGGGRAELTDFWPLLAALAFALLTIEWLVTLFRRGLRRQVAGVRRRGVGVAG